MATETLKADSASHSTALPVPREPHATIWRYLNFAKFIALLEGGTLFFPKTEQLPDTHEGADPPRRRTEVRAAVSSWHASDHESEAMWRLYSPIQEAIALRSTYARLRRALPECVRIHLVQYVDKPATDGSDPLAAFFFKRKAYEHEKELRAVIDRAPPGTNAVEEPSGWDVPVDIGRLVERVYVSPFAQGWFFGLTGKVCKRYGLDVPIEHSELTGTIQR